MATEYKNIPENEKPKSFEKLNISKNICNHIVGHDHQITHRCFCGTMVMAIGVVIAQSAHMFDGFIYHLALDVVGYGLHGIGAIPFIHLIENKA